MAVGRLTFDPAAQAPSISKPGPRLLQPFSRSLRLGGQLQGRLLVTHVSPIVQGLPQATAHDSLCPHPHQASFLECHPFATYAFKTIQRTTALRKIETNVAQLPQIATSI